MKNTLLYIATVIIWGTTWFAIEFQLGEVAVEVSLIYRFLIAAIIMWTFCSFAKISLKLRATDHFFIFILAGFNFGFNYLILYWAQEYLTSAMSSIAFSTLLLMNIVNTRIFFGKPVAKRVIVGALMGVCGIAALFWQDIKDFNLTGAAITGLLLALGGTFLASLGNMVSVRNTSKGVSVIQGNTWGMLYGTIILALYALVRGSEFTISLLPSYWISLLYLAIFGTVIAFACYFILFQNIGPEKASYVIVLFPLVAVILSTLYEGFIWHLSTIIGFTLVLSGNALVLTPPEKFSRLYRWSLRQSSPQKTTDKCNF
ncbi:DMT family transporter [Pleionea sediminis]|uniref:DMT family transporter n=1 Tax=Pleionea sediminis TaxID=2569479 RepID=UPI00118487BD|nr:EamA family transporter [Pleionea sediminis]